MGSVFNCWNAHHRYPQIKTRIWSVFSAGIQCRQNQTNGTANTYPSNLWMYAHHHHHHMRQHPKPIAKLSRPANVVLPPARSHSIPACLNHGSPDSIPTPHLRPQSLRRSHPSFRPPPTNPTQPSTSLPRPPDYRTNLLYSNLTRSYPQRCSSLPTKPAPSGVCSVHPP